MGTKGNDIAGADLVADAINSSMNIEAKFLKAGKSREVKNFSRPVCSR
jgi:hypothetical protein